MLLLLQQSLCVMKLYRSDDFGDSVIILPFTEHVETRQSGAMARVSAPAVTEGTDKYRSCDG